MCYEIEQEQSLVFLLRFWKKKKSHPHKHCVKKNKISAHMKTQKHAVTLHK